MTVVVKWNDLQGDQRRSVLRAMNAGGAPGDVPKFVPSIRENSEKPPRINVVTKIDTRTGRAKNVLRGLTGRRNPDATIWKVYKFLMHNPNISAASIALYMGLTMAQVTHAIRDLRKESNGSINVVCKNNIYKIAA